MASERDRRRSRGGSDLGARLLVAIPLIAFALFIVISGGLIFAAGVIVLGVLCLDELYKLLERAHAVKLAGFIGFIAMLAAAEFGSADQVLMVALAVFPLTFLLTVAAPRSSLSGIVTNLLGVWWIGFPLALAVLLRALPHGGGVIISVLVGTFVGDTGAYLGGRAFGRRPLAPSISPNKTLEGLLIGMVSAVAGVWFASIYQNWMSPGNAVLLGLGVAIAAPLGDLFESYVKREVGRKDSGTIFGAHGGALDRLDAVLFAAVVGYYVWGAMV